MLHIDERVDVLGNKHLFKFSESDSEMKLKSYKVISQMYIPSTVPEKSN